MNLGRITFRRRLPGGLWFTFSRPVAQILKLLLGGKGGA